MFRRARFVSLTDSGPALIRLCHDLTGASALVGEDTARIWLALPQERFVSCEQLAAGLGGPLGQCTPEELRACLEALQASGLVETPDARIPLGYDSVASEYDARPPHDPQLLEQLRLHTEPDHWQDVLDVATGTGVLLPALAAAGARNLSGVDISSRMLEQARARCAREGVAATLQQARAEALPFPDDALSLVVVGSALWWFDKPRFWREVYRVLREDGRAVVLTTVPDEPFYELLEPFLIRPRQHSHWEIGTIVHDLPGHVGLVHFSTCSGSVPLRDRAQLVALASSLAPRGSEDVPFAGLERFDGAGLSWPWTLPTVGSLAILRMHRV